MYKRSMQNAEGGRKHMPQSEKGKKGKRKYFSMN